MKYCDWDLEASAYWSFRRLKWPHRALANVKYLDALLFFKDAVDHAINVRLVAIEQVSQFTAFVRSRTSV